MFRALFPMYKHVDSDTSDCGIDCRNSPRLEDIFYTCCGRSCPPLTATSAQQQGSKTKKKQIDDSEVKMILTAGP